MMSSSTTVAEMVAASSINHIKFPLYEQLKLLPLKSPSSASSLFGKSSQHQQPFVIAGNGSRPIPSGFNDIPKKPMRPLTAYHIFFQIEREFVIQTIAGEDADKSIHDNKVYLDDVPLRYKNVRLLPDWFAGPGKRKKRKHRKQHGKIGFLELSRVISTRWSRLEELDPETKDFVQKIAQQELDEYYREMKEYKELTKDLVPMSVNAVAPKKKSKKRSSCGNVSSVQVEQPVRAQQQQHSMAPRPDNMLSASFPKVDLMPPTSQQLQNDINYFLSCIGNKARHLISPSNKKNSQQTLFLPSSRPDKGKVYQRQDSALSMSHFSSLLEMPYCENTAASQPVMKRQRVVSDSDISRTASSEVDICDDEILQLWKFHN